MLKKFREVDISTKLKRTNFLCYENHFLYNAHLLVSDRRKSEQICDIALGRCPTVISSFTTETVYLSLKLVSSLHKQVLTSVYFDSNGNHEYNL